MRYQWGVDGQPIFIGAIMIVGLGRKVNDHRFAVADVMIGMPDQRGNVHQAPVMPGKNNAIELVARGGIRSRIKEDQFDLAFDNNIAVFVVLMEPPTLHETRSDRKCISKY